MNSKIISISEYQNTITHESGFVSVFKEDSNGCLDCVYLDDSGDCLVFEAPCISPYRISDIKNGIFIPKTN